MVEKNEKKNRERNDIGTLQHIWKTNIGIYVYIIHHVLNIYELVHYNNYAMRIE